MRVVCLKSEWVISIKRYFTPYELPKKGEIYTVDFYEWEKENTYLALKEIPGGVYNSKGFRPVDDTFGEVICEILEQQIEYEKV